MQKTWHIDAAIERAETLPGWVYADPTIHQQMRERVFAASWQLVGDGAALARPGDVYPTTLLPDCLDEPLLLTRDAAGLHCLSNVCTHRGNLVCTEVGQEKSLRCRYHGRRFELDGSFKSMPEFEGVHGFPSAKDNLAHIPNARWKRFVFASMKPAHPFASLVDAMEARIGWLPVDDAKLVASRTRDYDVAASWALYCDNYLEGFHIPYVHAGLNKVIDYGSYATELLPFGVLQVGMTAKADEAFVLPRSSPDHGKQVAAYYYWLFPNTMLNFYPWGVSINIVKPRGPARCTVSYLTYVWDASRLDKGAGSGLDTVEHEDEEVVESVQLGVRSRWYDRGRYSPTREQGVHHFHRLLTDALAKA